MLSKFLDPKNDIAFKKIFGTPKNKDILIHFLNDMIVFKGGKPIVEVTFLKTLQDPEAMAKKTSLVDVLCEDQDHNTYIVEMQVAQHQGFEKRAQYYAAKAYTSQMERGGIYENLKEVIFIAIANFTMFPEKAAYKSDHVIFDRENGQHDLKDFSFTFLELTKFTKTKDQLQTMIDKWAYYFKNAEATPEQEIHTIFAHDAIILRAYEELDRFHWPEDDLRAYDAVIKHEMDYQASLDFKFAKGLEEGIEKGREEGIEKGKLEIAKKMLENGLALSLIGEMTGLDEKRLSDLRAELDAESQAQSKSRS